MPEVWVPGMAGPLDDFVARLHRKIEDFVGRRGHEQAVVEIEVVDGAQFTLHSISAEPGFGFVSLAPYPEDEQRPWPRAGQDPPVPPDELIVPLGSIKRITLNDAAERERRVGFALPEAAG